MIQHYWTVITKRSYTDLETNVLVIGESLEEVQIIVPKQLEAKFGQDIDLKKMVLMPFEFEIVSYLCGKDLEPAILETVVELPNGQITKIAEARIDFKQNDRMRNRLKSNGLLVSGSGMQIFRVYEVEKNEKKLLAEIPVFITLKFE